MLYRDFLVKFLGHIFYVIACILCMQSVAEEIVSPLYEQKIKAGLVYNLIKYTEWPKTAFIAPNQVKNNNQAALTICIFGNDPFDGYLSPLQGRTAQQAVISIIHVNSIPEIQSCSVIIIHRNQREQLPNLFTVLHNKNILTISDIENFAELGGMVELARQEEKVVLQINKNSLDSAKLIIDARMLKLANIVSSQGGAQ